MNLTIEAGSTMEFAVTLDGAEHTLTLRGGDWRLNGYWIASARIDWPEAVARALRVLTNAGMAARTVTALQRHMRRGDVA